MNRAAVSKPHDESPDRSQPAAIRNLKLAGNPARGRVVSNDNLGEGVEADPKYLEKNRRFSAELLGRLRFLTGLRPSALGSMLVKLLSPENRRRIIPTSNGLRIYADPFTHLGRALLDHGTLEADTENVFRAHLQPGGVFLDIGANEGYFSALAGRLVGPNGYVIAVEPQSRLRDIIELNLRINDIRRYRIYSNAFGGQEGAEGRINLWPTQNTGASGLVRSYRFSRATETITFVSLERIFAESGIDHVDFVKVDVEGFEGDVVRYLVPHLRRQRVGTLFLDYHRSILERNGVDPRDIHQEIVSAGYRIVAGDASKLDSYCLYQPAQPSSRDAERTPR